MYVCRYKKWLGLRFWKSQNKRNKKQQLSLDCTLYIFDLDKKQKQWNIKGWLKLFLNFVGLKMSFYFFMAPIIIINCGLRPVVTKTCLFINSGSSTLFVS